MSKNNVKEAETVEEMPLDVSQGKTVNEVKDIAQALQAQLQEHQKQARHHNTMATKAQGALEVMLQMIPKKEVEEMIANESAQEKAHQSNGQAVN